MRRHAKHNPYAAAIATTYHDVPKSVYAAIAYAFASRLFQTSDPQSIEYTIVREWQTLRDAGIVPQRVRIPRRVLGVLQQRELFPQAIGPEKAGDPEISTGSTGVHRSNPPV